MPLNEEGVIYVAEFVLVGNVAEAVVFVVVAVIGAVVFELVMVGADFPFLPA